MSIVKSFSVGDGDMFYINHGSDNFSIIDCFLSNDNKEDILSEIKGKIWYKNVVRFISTHPDEDHICGLEYLDDEISLNNFYCVKNNANKEDETNDFEKYCELRDSDKVFCLEKSCSRRWMNLSSEERDSAGINILWPVTTNSYFKDELKKAEAGESPNNISPIITYKLNEGVTVLWMGDLEKDFMENVKDEVSLPKTNILFAPHHGRESGKIPGEWIEAMDPDIIVMGEAPSENLDYAAYDGYNKITQNSAKDITFECEQNMVHIYVSNENYSVDFLENEYMNTYDNYIGTLNI